MARVFTGNQSWHYTADFKNTTIEAKGKRVPKYEDIKGPPTIEEFIAHLNGVKGLLVIPITKAGACRWGKIDIDEYPTDPKKWARAIKRWGLPLIVELSKSGGSHLAHYSPYTESATDMRGKLADWAAAVHAPPKCELFPKQERLMDGEPGSGINLPYFGGDAESTRNYAIDADGNRLTVAKWLDIIERMPAKASHTPGQVNVEAAADLLSKHWTDGQRDNLNMAVAGTLLRAGVATDTVQQILDGSSDIVADDATRKTAEQVEKAIADGKRIPGYKTLAEIIGPEEAREFMRLAGGKPPVDPVPFSFATVDAEWLSVAPPPVTYTIEPLLPSGVVGLLVAEGGAGKTTFGLRAAVAVAGGRDLFDLPTKQGRVVYIACEEHEAALRRRLFWIVSRERERMRGEGLSAERIELFEQSILANLTLRSAVGYEMYLISSRSGETAQSGLVEALIEKLPRPLELLLLDPISRLNGAEENSNQVGTALINSAERIAREMECTVMLCHHTGKAAAKERDTGLYAARGASGFVDAARSSIRLLAADMSDARMFGNVPAGVIEAGDLIQVIHNKSNEGPRAKPFWLRRQALDFERFEPELLIGVESHAKILMSLYNWYAANKSVAFSPSRILGNKELRAEIWKGMTVSRDRVRETIDKGRDDGDLIPTTTAAARTQHALIKFRDDYASDNM
jgi:hypothetical protein